MKLEHIAIWTHRLEDLKDFYVQYFDGVASTKYNNTQSGFSSYFITFDSGARLEIMYKPDIPDNLNDVVGSQYRGIIHLAFGVETTDEVNAKMTQLKDSGLPILRGPRVTGDGYFEFETLDPDGNRLEVTTKYKK